MLDKFSYLLLFLFVIPTALYIYIYFIIIIISPLQQWLNSRNHLLRIAPILEREWRSVALVNSTRVFSISRPRPNIIPVYEFKHIGKIKINWKAKCLRSQFSDVRVQSRDLETVKVHFSNRIVKRIPHDNRYTSRAMVLNVEIRKMVKKRRKRRYGWRK